MPKCVDFFKFSKYQIRNTKSETNPKHEIRNIYSTVSDFGFRACFVFRVSDLTLFIFSRSFGIDPITLNEKPSLYPRQRTIFLLNLRLKPASRAALFRLFTSFQVFKFTSLYSNNITCQPEKPVNL